jgi:hypothetical protein
MSDDEYVMLELLRDIVAASDSVNGERLMECVDYARELVEEMDRIYGKVAP